jgi:hypothetical protein
LEEEEEEEEEGTVEEKYIFTKIHNMKKTQKKDKVNFR